MNYQDQSLTADWFVWLGLWLVQSFLKLKLGEPKGLSVRRTIYQFGVNQPKRIQIQSSQLQLALKNKDTMSLNVNVVPDITDRKVHFPLGPEEVEF